MTDREKRRDRRSPAKRAQILAAATTAFLRDGYTRVGMDAIAEAAGVGKQTVYSHFDNKDALFLEVIRSVTETPSDIEVASPRTKDPRDDLEAAVEAVIERALEPTVAALHRLTIAELPHHPELQQMWRDGQDFPGEHVISSLIAQLRRTELHRRGRKPVAAPEDDARAARQLVLLAVTQARVATLWGTQELHPATRHEIARSSTELITNALAYASAHSET